MNEFELKKLWQTTNDKLEENFVINKKMMDDITRVKVHSILGSMKPIKIFTLLVGVLWVGIGGFALFSIYLNAFSDANKFFLFSASLVRLIVRSLKLKILTIMQLAYLDMVVLAFHTSTQLTVWSQFNIA